MRHKSIAKSAAAADITPPKKFEFSRRDLKSACEAWDRIGKPVTIYDTYTRGLVCRKQAAGWVFTIQKKIRGKVRRASLGAVPPWDQLNMGAVRGEAVQVLADLVAGTHQPQQVKNEKLKAEDTMDTMTLLEAVDYHFEQKDSYRDTTVNAYKQAAEKFDPRLTNKAMRAITRHDVKKSYKACMERTSRATAAVYARSLKAVYATWLHSFDIDSGRRPEYNVFTEGLKTPAGKSVLKQPPARQRRLDDGDHKPWYQALLAEQESKGVMLASPFRALEVLYQTGMRSQEVFRLTWDEIQDDFIVLQPERVKTGNFRELPFRKPITRRVRELLDAQRREVPQDCPWVFPSWARRGEVPISDVRKAMKAVCDAAGVTVSPHDLRRTWAAAAEVQGVSLHKVAALANHSLPGVTSKYIGTESRQLLAELGKAAQDVEDLLLKLGGAS